ncbi:MAG: peptidylprolyl isomerase [Caldilineaceae bacterium]|nr:peptidylprolyl isomerase [Caldilineaceae bacterium]
MAKRKKHVEEEPRELTRKEIRTRARDRERNRRLFIGAGVAIGLALLLIIIGAVITYTIRPNSAIATVGGQQIITRDFWKRVRFEKRQMENQLAQMQQLQAQFGQNFFASQIMQLQSTLASPFAMGIQVLDRMIDEVVIEQQAATRGITVSADEVEAALREEIANSRGAVTEPQATETADAAGIATATAESWTPTPTATLDTTGVVTATATPFPTPEPLPTSPIISDTGYTEGINLLTENLGAAGGLTLDEYRNLIRLRLLSERLEAAITDETVMATEEQVHARHILIAIRDADPTLENNDETSDDGETDALTDTETVTVTTALTDLTALTATATVTATEEAIDEASSEAPVGEEAPAEDELTEEEETVTETPAVSDAMTETATITVTESVTETEADDLAASEPLTDTTTADELEEITFADPNAPRTEAEALALAESIRMRILAGEDFAALAAEYSDDPGSGANGGDLGWFGRGRMVPEFEEAAFTLPLNVVSEPVKTDFGYHLIEVLEKDDARPKDENQVLQERQQAFQSWLQEQKLTINIERPQDLASMLPPDLR